MKSSKLQALVLATSLIASSALARSSSSSSSSATAEEAGAPTRWIDRITMAYAGQYIGPSLGRPSAMITDEYGQNTPSKQYVDSILATGYKLNDHITAGLNINFNYTPVMGHDLRLKDPAIKVVNKKMVNSGNFNLLSDARIYPGVTSASQAASKIGAFRTTQLATYSVGKWTAGVLGIGIYYLYGGSADRAKAQDFSVYIGPNIAYQFLPKLGATLAYELAGAHGLGAGVADWVRDGTDLQAGLSWDITPDINFNPYLQLSTGGRIDMDSTSFGAYISAKFL